MSVGRQQDEINSKGIEQCNQLFNVQLQSHVQYSRNRVRSNITFLLELRNAFVVMSTRYRMEGLNHHIVHVKLVLHHMLTGISIRTLKSFSFKVNSFITLRSIVYFSLKDQNRSFYLMWYLWKLNVDIENLSTYQITWTHISSSLYEIIISGTIGVSYVFLVYFIAIRATLFPMKNHIHYQIAMKMSLSYLEPTLKVCTNWRKERIMLCPKLFFKGFCFWLFNTLWISETK